VDLDWDVVRAVDILAALNSFKTKVCSGFMCREGWPELYIYTVYGHIFGGFPAKNTVVYTVYIYIYMCGSGQPYLCDSCFGALLGADCGPHCL